MPIPNLFDFATSELSQDAVLAWLFGWAAPEAAEADPALGAAARALVQACYHKHSRVAPSITSVQIELQADHMDLRVEINGTDVLVIEDKAHIREHSGQLARYVQLVQETAGAGMIVPIYVQTGEQDDYKPVEQAGFRVIHRRDLLDILQTAVEAGCTNAILLDFRDHLARREYEVQSFRCEPVANWTRLAWHGFFAAVSEVLPVRGWGTVGARWATFEGMWWHFHPLLNSGSDNADSGELPAVYLQVESGHLRFKMLCPAGFNCRDLRGSWNLPLIRAAVELELSGFQPALRRRGKYQTVAEIAGDFRSCASDGTLNWEETLSVLQQAQAVLDRGLRYWEASLEASLSYKLPPDSTPEGHSTDQ